MAQWIAEWMTEWCVFVGVMALGQFSPGPDMLLLTRTALASGRKAGCWTAIGISCGLVCHAAIAVTGVATLLSKGGRLGIALKWAAAVYLSYLAFQLIRSGLRSGSLKISGDAVGVEDGSFENWKRGLFCNLLNPKVALFLAGVTAPFLSINHAPSGWPFILGSTVVLEGVALWCLWAWVLQWKPLKMGYLKAAHWFDLGFGVVLLGLIGVLLSR